MLFKSKLIHFATDVLSQLTLIMLQVSYCTTSKSMIYLHLSNLLSRVQMDNEKFKKVIESCHLNFLIGSGASRNYFETLGNVEQLLTDLYTHPQSNERDIVEVSIKRDYFKKAISGNIDLVYPSLIADPTEYQHTKENYQEFLIALNIILLKRRSTLISKQVNLFTTNMDLFIDLTLEELNFEYNDGFSGKLNPSFSTSNYRKSIFQKSPHYENRAEIPLFNLFKLHGSVTWSIIGEKIGFDQTVKILRDIANIKVTGKLLENFRDSSGVAKPINDLLNEAASLSKDPTFEAFNTAYDELVMINPTKEKFNTTTMNYTYYELLRMYSNELEKENSVLFVVGFSFADEHIREITKRVANSNPTLLVCVFAYSDDGKREIEQKLNMSEFKFSNVEVIKAGSFGDINKSWFAELAKNLDQDLYLKKKNDIVLNVTLPPSTT
jgi:hypothetical protein